MASLHNLRNLSRYHKGGASVPPEKAGKRGPEIPI
jgi:hypothetical protein